MMRRTARTVLAALGLVLVVMSFLPLVQGNLWWVRLLDFPRLQLAGALVVVGTLFVVAARPLRMTGWALLLLIAAGLGYHGWKLLPYLRHGDPAAVAVETCAVGANLSILLANVEMTNRRAEPMLALVRERRPDVVVVLETDAWWARQLQPLDALYPHTIQDVTGGSFGIHLFSKLPLVAPEITARIGEATPAIHTNLRLENGEMVRLIAIHPQPPGLFEPSTNRDAQILTAALDLAEHDIPGIVAGDFNAVPWERVMQRSLRLGGLLDPRIGRGFLATYHVTRMPLVAWPIDHVLFQAKFGLLSFDVGPAIASDHYPVQVELCLHPPLALTQPPPRIRSDDMEQARTSISKALRRGGGE